MVALNDDSLLIRIGRLTGMHEDAVRCIYDERVNRLKPDRNSPDIQLSGLDRVVDDAYAFWVSVSNFPEDFEGRREKLSGKLGGFFDRVVRYANYHDDTQLTEEQKARKAAVIEKAMAKKAQVAIAPPK